MSNITWTDKVDGASDATGKLSAADANEVKSAVNSKQNAMGTDDNYVTDAEKIIIGNTSGINTGDSATPAETTTTVGALLNSADEMTVPVDTDMMGIRLAATGLWQKISWSTLKTLFSAIFPVSAGKSGGQTLIGGTAVTDILKLQGTSENGTATSPAIQALVGNNGATVAYTVLNNGNVGWGTTNPAAKLDVSGGGIGMDDGQFLGVRYTGQTFVRSIIGTSALTTMIRQANVNTSINFQNYVGNLTYMSVGSTGGLSLGSTYVGTDPGAGNMIIQGKVGIGTPSPTKDLSLGGQVDRTLWLERNTTADTAGNSLTVQGGGATSGATNKNGGTKIVSGGISTGTGESGVQIKGYSAGLTGTADNTAVVGVEVLGNKVGLFGVAPVLRPTTGISAAAFVANTSLIANDTATYGGYTIGQIAAALKAAGILT